MKLQRIQQSHLRRRSKLCFCDTQEICDYIFILKCPVRYGVKYASDCEVCKVLATEFEARMSETGRTHDVVETGYSHTKEKKKTKYVTSELRLIETMDGICDRILEYNIHKERKDSTRFAKGQSETFSTLEGLVAKGVKVDIGIPHELWNKPSAEVTQLKTQCEVKSPHFLF